MKDFQKFVASLFIFGFLMSLVVLGSLGFGQISAQLPKAVTVILVLLVFVGAIWLSVSLIWTKKKALEASPVASSEQAEAVEPAESKDEPLSLAVKILFYLGMFFIIGMPIVWIQENSAKRDYAVAVNATHATDCNVFKKAAKRDRCIIDYLAQTETRIDVTTEMCASIEDSYNRDNCFDLIGERTKNAAICAKIGSTDLKEICMLRVQTDNEQNPYIGSIYPNPARKGDLINITGSNLNGFEGDIYFFFERADGKTVRIPGILSEQISGDAKGGQTAKIVLKESCQPGETIYGDYSGIPSICDYVELTPGIYKVYTKPWSKMSNEISFEITK